jgi:hypothetical protein
MLNSAGILYAYLKLMNYLHTHKFDVRNVMRTCKDFSRLVNFGFYTWYQSPSSKSRAKGLPTHLEFKFKHFV